jgi:hypothetical protein
MAAWTLLAGLVLALVISLKSTPQFVLIRPLEERFPV